MTNVQDKTVEHLTDEEILEGVRKGDELSQGRLYRRYYSKVLARCKGSLGNVMDADEVTNKIFFYLFSKGMEKFDASKGTSVETWLTRYVARDFIHKELKKQRTQEAKEETFCFVDVTDEDDVVAMEDRLQADGDYSPEGLLSSAEDTAKLHAAIDKLPKKDADLCTLLYKEGLSLMQAASQLGLNYSTASTRRRRAVVKLIELA